MAKDKDLKTPNVPPLRFPGFSDEWVKVSLGDIGETLIGLTYSPKDVVANDGTIVFRSSNIQDGMIDYTDLVRVNKPIKERIVTRENDILICARNGSQRLIGKNALLTKADEGNTFGAFMMIYRSDDNDVIHPILSTRRYISQVSENLGARINQITTSDLNSFEFYIPSNCIERRKIGKLFALINERIATQNKIIDNLQSLIKGLIQCLSQEGLANGRWHKIMLSEILTERNELNEAYHPVHSVSVSAGVVNQVEYLGRSFAAKDTAHYHVVYNGDIVYTKSPTGNQPYGIVKQSHCLTPAAVSPLYGVYQPSSFEVGNYLHYYFLNPLNTNNYLSPLIQKGAKNTINISNQRFLENRIPLPIDEMEVKLVSDSLSALDKKLMLEFTVLTSLKRQKNFLLRNLFI